MASPVFTLNLPRPLLDDRPHAPGVLCATFAAADFRQCSQRVAAFDECIAMPLPAWAASATGVLVAQFPIPNRVALFDNAAGTAVVSHPAPTGSQGDGEPGTVQLFSHEAGNGLVVKVNRHISILGVLPCTWCATWRT